MSTTKKAKPARCLYRAGSAFSRTPLRAAKGLWVYRNFHVANNGVRWLILSACGDSHPAKSLANARKQIDAWYAEGSVES